MTFSLAHVVQLLTQYGYWILFPLAVVEGPIITIIGGFLSSLGILQLGFVYLVVLAGDFVGDSFFYVLGRWGSGPLDRHGHHIGLTHERLESAREFFRRHHGKAIITTKLAQGIGPIGLIAAGSLRISYRTYIATCFLVTCCQAAVFLTIGFFFGHAYLKIGQYLNYFAGGATVLVFLIIVVLLLKKWKIKRS